jgi:hypothetical protein
VITLPATAGNFWLVPEASALTGASRATLVATHYVNARRPDPGPWSEPSRPEGAASLPVFLPSRQEVVSAILTAEHFTEPKLPRTRDMSYPQAFLVEPPEHTVRGKMPGLMYHTRRTCDFFSTSLDVHGTRASRRTCRRHPQSPPAYMLESPAEVFDGRCCGRQGHSP